MFDKRLLIDYEPPLCLYSVICLLATYLIGGFLYQRLVVGAKGMEQFPNIAFWQEFGNLTAVHSSLFKVFSKRTGPQNVVHIYMSLSAGQHVIKNVHVRLRTAE